MIKRLDCYRCTIELSKKTLEGIWNLDIDGIDIKAFFFVHNNENLVKDIKDMRDLVNVKTLLW